MQHPDELGLFDMYTDHVFLFSLGCPFILEDTRSKQVGSLSSSLCFVPFLLFVSFVPAT